MENEKTFGKCGDQVNWSFDRNTGTLLIYGQGPMFDFNENLRPSFDIFKSLISSVIVRNGVTTLGTFTFNKYPILSKAVLGNTCTDVREFAFASLGVPLMFVAQQNIP